MTMAQRPDVTRTSSTNGRMPLSAQQPWLLPPELYDARLISTLRRAHASCRHRHRQDFSEHPAQSSCCGEAVSRTSDSDLSPSLLRASAHPKSVFDWIPSARSKCSSCAVRRTTFNCTPTCQHAQWTCRQETRKTEVVRWDGTHSLTTAYPRGLLT